MHTFICNTSMSIDILKKNKFLENLAKLFSEAMSVSFHKDSKAIDSDNPDLRNFKHFPTVRITRPENDMKFSI